MAIVPDPEMMDELVRRTTPGTGPKPLSYEELLARYRWLCEHLGQLDRMEGTQLGNGAACLTQMGLNPWRWLCDFDSVDALVAQNMTK